MVVVGVDGSEFAARAVRWGASEAARRNVALRLIHAVEWVDDLTAGGSHRESDIDRARRIVDVAAREAARLEPGIEVQQQVIVGFAIAVLVAESRRAQLVVVGDRGHSRTEGMLMGSVPVALAVHAACPVVVARGAEIDSAEIDSAEIDSAEIDRPVVVGVDGSPLSEAAIAFAFDAASARRARLVAVHTWRKPLGTEDEERMLLAERLAGWSEKYPDVQVEAMVAAGRPTTVLLGLSAGAALVVVGSRRHGDFTGLVLGSVSNALLHKADCPVAVVAPDVGVGDQGGS